MVRSLRIHKCGLFSEDGLVCVSRYCTELRTLCLENNTLVGMGNGCVNWLCVTGLLKRSIVRPLLVDMM